MATVTYPAARSVRILGAIACLISLAVAILVRVGLNDGGWPLFVPSVAAAAVVIWPIRSVLAMAIALNAAILVLGLMTVGILYGFSLAALVFALAPLRAGGVAAGRRG